MDTDREREIAQVTLHLENQNLYDEWMRRKLGSRANRMALKLLQQSGAPLTPVDGGPGLPQDPGIGKTREGEVPPQIEDAPQGPGTLYG